MTEGSTVSYDTDGAVAVITIERPAARNAVNHATARALAAAFRRFDSDASSSVAILTGRGGAFCAGFDLKETVPVVAATELRTVTRRWDRPG